MGFTQSYCSWGFPSETGKSLLPQTQPMTRSLQEDPTGQDLDRQAQSTGHLEQQTQTVGHRHKLLRTDTNNITALTSAQVQHPTQALEKGFLLPQKTKLERGIEDQCGRPYWS